MSNFAVKKDVIRFLVKILSILFIVWLCFAFRSKLPSAEVWRSVYSQEFRSAGFHFILLFSLALFLRSIRFGILFHLCAFVSLARSILLFPWIFTVGAFTPFRLGEGVRLLWVNRFGGSKSLALVYFFAERFSDLLCLLIILLVGSYRFLSLSEYSAEIFCFMLAVVLAVYLIIWKWHDFMAELAYSRFEGRFGKVLGDFLTGFNYMNNFPLHMSVLLLTIAIWVIMITAFFCMFNATLRLDETLPAAALTLASVNLAGLFSFIPGNTGSYHLAALGSLSAFGVQVEIGIVTITVMHGLNILTTFFWGVLSRLAMFFMVNQSIDSAHD